MREIKFRCWDIVRNKMRFEIDLWDIPYNELFIHTPDQRALNLMQYTGLKDKNGKEIYEGDIIEFYSNVEDCFISGKVEYHFGIIRVRDYILANKYSKCKVIGNIYENKELSV